MIRKNADQHAIYTDRSEAYKKLSLGCMPSDKVHKMPIFLINVAVDYYAIHITEGIGADTDITG